MRVLGIDPGLGACGFALLERAGGDVRVLDLGCWITAPASVIPTRLAELMRDVDGYVDEHGPQVLAIETPTSPRVARAVAMLWGAYGTIQAVAAQRGLLLVKRSPVEWRKLIGLATGKRRGTRKDGKNQTSDAMRMRFPGARALLASTPAGLHEHALDALAIACSWVDVAGGINTQEEAAA